MLRSKASFAAAVVAVLLTAIGCAGDGGSAKPLNVVVANYELVAGTDGRFIAGMSTVEGNFINYGSVRMRFSYLGDRTHVSKAQFVSERTSDFLPLPGEAGGRPQSAPEAMAPSDGRGLYKVEPINFDRPGFWQVDASLKLKDGSSLSGFAAFEVLAASQVPAPGEKALRSENVTITSAVPPSAIDSRARSVADVPDAAMHRLTIAQALDEHKPLVIVFSTPVFCVSRFCGPVTDMVGSLAGRFERDVNFIHVEIWEDFRSKTANPAAIEWLYRENELHEPWVFLVGADGVIVKRWDNVVTEGEIVAALDPLLTRRP